MAKARQTGAMTAGVVGLGGMAVDEYDPPASEKEAVELFRYAVDRGVSLIDTADVYGRGRNEELIGKALAKSEAERLVATKAGCTRPGGKGWGVDGRPEHIGEAVRGSLKRLGVDRIRLYQLHAPDGDVPLEETLGAFADLQSEGLVELVGVSNFTTEQVKRARKVVDVVSVQNHFNLSHKSDEKELLPYLSKESIAYIPYFPLGSGKVLTNDALVSLAERESATPARLALAWIITRWPTAVPIPGTKQKAHYDDNRGAAELELSEDVMEELDRLY